MNDLKRIFSHLGPFKKEFLLSVLFVVLETSFELVIPLIMADVIDIGVVNRDVPYIIGKGVQMGICAILSLITGLLYARYAARAAMGFGSHIREAEYQKIQSYSFSNLDHFETSSLITRMTTDITVMQNALTGGFRPMVRGPVMLILGLILAFIMNAKLALVFIVCAPILAIILIFIIRKVAPMYGVLQRAMDHVNSVVQENLTAIRTVKAYVRGTYEEEGFDEANQSLMQTSQQTFHFAVMNLPAFQFTMYAAIVLILWFGGNFVQTGTMEVGSLTGFLSYVMQIINSLMMTRSLASARRINEVFDETPTIREKTDAAHTIPNGRIDFNHVFFKYSDTAEEYTLSDVDLHFSAGQTIGIIGGTGSSKTSLVQLIPRLYDVSSGSVCVAGTDVRSCSLEHLRDAVGIVLQKNVLFSGTIRDNLRWGNPDATEEELNHACHVACADEFISHFPDGLDTWLEQGGVNLSGGQKQRLCIARTLLKKPKILIFDDSTSAVDTATESKIRRELASIKDMTKLIIAQRITSVMYADQIVIMDDGKVHAVGTHETLLESDPIYQEIYDSQMKGGMANGAV